MAEEKRDQSWNQPEDVRALSIGSTAYYAIQQPDSGVGPSTLTLVVLHGWGQNCRYFLRKFSPLARQGVLVIAPQAPHQFYLDMESRKVGFGWLTAYDRGPGIENGVALVETVLNEVERELGLSKSRPFVLGFSQGVSMAWRYAMRGEREVAGIIACGGDLPPDVEEALPGADIAPVMLVHGKDDTVVPWSKAEAAEHALRNAGIDPELHYFDGSHDLPASLLDRLPKWMEERTRPV